MSSSMSMSMPMPMSTSTTSATAAATSSAMSPSGMGTGGGSSDGVICKISMLWNWYTIDACFLSRQWHVSSHGVFAVSCIGVVLLVITLEGLRRTGKMYDQFLLAQFRRQAAARQNAGLASETSTESSGTNAPALQTFRYTPLQQLIRSVIHMATFAVAYFIMLLAMYFNGYIIISIFIGALFGKFLCDWESIRIPMNPVSRGAQQTTEVPKNDQDLTYCCG